MEDILFYLKKVVSQIYIELGCRVIMKKSPIPEKRMLFVLMFLVLMLNVFSFPILASGDIAYIYKNDRLVDDNVVDVFDDLGLSVDLIDEDDINGMDFSTYKFLFVGDERFRNEDQIPIDKYPSIVSMMKASPVLL